MRTKPAVIAAAAVVPLLLGAAASPVAAAPAAASASAAATSAGAPAAATAAGTASTKTVSCSVYNGAWKGEAEVTMEDYGPTYRITLERYRMTVPAHAAGRSKANTKMTGLTISGSGLSFTKHYSYNDGADDRLQDGQWHRVDQVLTGPIYSWDGVRNYSGEVKFVFDVAGMPDYDCSVSTR